MSFVKQGGEAAIKAAVATAVSRIAEGAHHFLVSAAQETLHATAQSYIRGLMENDSVKIETNRCVVQLVGAQANALENGWDSFDMKPGLLGGKKFANIMFRFATPKKDGGAKSFVGPTMSQDAYKAIKNAQRRNPGAHTIRSSFTGKAEKPWYATGRESAMLAVRGYGPKDRQYLTFRRVSRNSDPRAFIHPGFEGAQLFPKAREWVEEYGPLIVKDALREQGVTIK